MYSLNSFVLWLLKCLRHIMIIPLIKQPNISSSEPKNCAISLSLSVISIPAFCIIALRSSSLFFAYPSRATKSSLDGVIPIFLINFILLRIIMKIDLCRRVF
ncbi:hypothetical protein GLOIN_2v1650548, partial [Rhizophagus irregularis DAOM 181602=DAOM 197198]